MISRLLTSAAALGLTAGMAAAEYKLTILHTNDIHSRIESINKYDSTCGAEDEAEGKCFGGIARVKAKVDEMRSALEGQNVLLLDAGDPFQGSLFYTTYKGAAEAEFMEDIGYDAMAVGNHEFGDGPVCGYPGILYGLFCIRSRQQGACGGQQHVVMGFNHLAKSYSVSLAQTFNEFRAFQGWVQGVRPPV